jgi:UTP--glucose-1-phosphate uridylyltransferase
MAAQVNTAIFPVAGLGTRFLPATKATPKELLPVLDTPLIQYAIDEAREAGVERSCSSAIPRNRQSNAT